jgi:hypothetical protein
MAGRVAADQYETNAANAGLVQALQLRISHGGVDHGDTARLRSELPQRIDDDAVVRSVYRRLNDDMARCPEPLLK